MLITNNLIIGTYNFEFFSKVLGRDERQRRDARKVWTCQKKF